jgi:hypothetical protein
MIVLIGGVTENRTQLDMKSPRLQRGLEPYETTTPNFKFS